MNNYNIYFIRLQVLINVVVITGTSLCDSVSTIGCNLQLRVIKWICFYYEYVWYYAKGRGCLRRIFGPKRNEVTGEWRKFHNEKLYDLYSSPDIIRQVKSRRMR
jgi:hypothetical protein